VLIKHNALEKVGFTIN